MGRFSFLHTMSKPQGLPATRRLKSRRAINRLFGSGASTSVYSYPLKLVYAPAEVQPGAEGEVAEDYRAAFVVPKRRFKRAVDRNLLKRRMREAYRLARPDLPARPGEPLDLMVIYVGKEEQSFNYIQRKLRKLLRQL